jgi:hypothetical protein
VALASSLAGNRPAALRLAWDAEPEGDADARFARANSTAFGMPDSNAELARPFPAMGHEQRSLP